MRYLYIAVVVIFFGGCAVTQVPYQSLIDEQKVNHQYIEHEECTYLLGPIIVSDELKLETVIENTITKAQEEGMVGDKLVNVSIKEGGYSVFLFSKLCLYINGNLTYSDLID
ncbi:MAG: hypothetical protein U9O56_07295 [Campylobacterota bacterium]|nr:hypothetical protein [Campylobacterota bacterium]